MEIQHLVSNCFNEQFCIVLRVVMGKKPRKSGGIYVYKIKSCPHKGQLNPYF